ncbi:MAG: hypothetical protein QXP70_01450 [Methanomassiliicoccales archaeon]
MQLSVEFILAWVIIFLPVSVWLWRHAYYRARSRLWSLATLFGGPAGIALFFLTSSNHAPAANSAALQYEIRIPQAVPPVAYETSAADEKTQPAVAESRYMGLTGLPRCPHCGTAVSRFDTKCIRCGQQLRSGLGSS